MVKSLTASSTGLGPLIAAVRELTRTPSDWQDLADRAVEALAAQLPTAAAVLAAVPPQQAGAAVSDEVRSQVLHVEDDGSFSMVALMLRPGQETVIHDHVTWCAVGMLQGLESEELFTVDADGVLTPAGSTLARPGDVSGFAPPGDIHRIRNVGDDLSVSINVYGTDVARIGSSVRRIYEPVFER